MEKNQRSVDKTAETQEEFMILTMVKGMDIIKKYRDCDRFK